MNKFLIYFLIFFPIRYSFGQNLVKNSSFEDTISCPNGPGQVDKCLYWSSVNNSPDYFNSCSKIEVGIPNNIQGNQYASHGNAYMGLFTFCNLPNGREIIQGELEAPLDINETYYFSLMVSTAEKSVYASNNVGIAFSINPYPYSFNNLIHLNQAEVKSLEIITDSIKWVKIRGSFVADSNFKYIQIGNFYSDSLTDTVNIGLFHSFALSYYYIDEICVSKDSNSCKYSLKNNLQHIDEEIEIFPNPFNNFLVLQSNTKKAGYSVQIFNVNSELILEYDFNENTIVDTSNILPGIYFCIISNSDGIIESKKIIKCNY